MPFAENSMVQGTFTVPGTLPGSLNLNLGFLPTRFIAKSTTQIGAADALETIERMEWDSTAPGHTLVEWHTASATTMNFSDVTVNGISLYDGHNSVLLGPAMAGTTITKAASAVCTTTPAHGLQTGDVVIITNNNIMTQLGGLYFTVTVTGANTFTIPLNTNTANFVQETGYVVRKLIVGPLYYPQRRYISNITAANPMVVSTNVAHGMLPGQQVRLRIPTAFGMTQANNLQGVITAVTAQTFTLGGIDSSAFTAFAWPASTAVPFTPPQVIPVGSGPIMVTVGGATYADDLIWDATTNQQFQGITIGTGVLLASAAGTVGSVARGESKENSDVDVLVSMDKHDDLLDFVRLKFSLEKKLRRKVDLVTYGNLSPFIKKSVTKEQVRIL